MEKLIDFSKYAYYKILLGEDYIKKEERKVVIWIGPSLLLSLLLFVSNELHVLPQKVELLLSIVLLVYLLFGCVFIYMYLRRVRLKKRILEYKKKNVFRIRWKDDKLFSYWLRMCIEKTDLYALTEEQLLYNKAILERKTVKEIKYNYALISIIISLVALINSFISLILINTFKGGNMEIKEEVIQLYLFYFMLTVIFSVGIVAIYTQSYKGFKSKNETNKDNILLLDVLLKEKQKNKKGGLLSRLFF